MFSYGICEGVGAIFVTAHVIQQLKLLNNMCRYKKNYGKTFSPWFGILTTKILAPAICDTRQKKSNI